MRNKNILEQNKALVSQFYDLALNRRGFDAASKYLRDYRQHNLLRMAPKD